MITMHNDAIADVRPGPCYHVPLGIAESWGGAKHPATGCVYNSSQRYRRSQAICSKAADPAEAFSRSGRVVLVGVRPHDANGGPPSRSVCAYSFENNAMVRNHRRCGLEVMSECVNLRSSASRGFATVD